MRVVGLTHSGCVAITYTVLPTKGAVYCGFCGGLVWEGEREGENA